jgi:hypothetical protein
MKLHPRILQEETEITETEIHSLFPPLPPVQKHCSTPQRHALKILQKETEITETEIHSQFPPLPPVQKIAPVLP